MKILCVLLLSTICSLGLSGCAATGTQVKESQLSQFHKGKTTKEQVIQALGQPNNNITMSNGQQMACYSYVKVTPRPEGFIPYVGMFAGGADAVSNTVCLTFSKNNMYESYTSSSSQSGSGYGLEAGYPGPRISSEPKEAK